MRAPSRAEEQPFFRIVQKNRLLANKKGKTKQLEGTKSETRLNLRQSSPSRMTICKRRQL
jgi:hypothetical protein